MPDTTFDPMERGMDAPGWLLNRRGGGHEFRDECGESLNLAINSVADVLHTLCTEARQRQRGDLNGEWLDHSGRCAIIALWMAVSGGTTMMRT